MDLPPRGLMTIGVVSDTHGRVRTEILDRFRRVDLIVHAGDVGSPSVLEILGDCAPVIAVRGNVDTGPWAAELPRALDLRIGGHRILVVHDPVDLPRVPGHPPAVVISGHSHRPRIERRDGILHFNPGSAGPRRFRLPVSVGFLTVAPSSVEATLSSLDATSAERADGFQGGPPPAR